MHLREAVTDDLDLLTGLLVDTVNWAGQTRMTRAQVIALPELHHCVAGWKRPTDFGLVALDDDEAPLGAIWARLFPDDDPGYGFISHDIPELGMAVHPGRRGTGVGRLLLRGCIEQARTAGCSALSLSVEDGNHVARTLYERHHFRVVGRTGASDTMRRDLGAQPA
ncbi:GNAT family N-acetyltransferase [Pengzhenrongella frigida]|uniref:GNAT family N-acetyltransferase n=1 Tax=Pengzhenrongella frigida TaxID=1259133 RepID=A0A4Q5N0E3_9MICO|nr:GNAT family N-acetyltransferase [Cellulomonas sp. HLT2-17]RYV49957.1 GNAT family N-acetyltransferase [Cellulomonas sp. HLT2-17]